MIIPSIRTVVLSKLMIICQYILLPEILGCPTTGVPHVIWELRSPPGVSSEKFKKEIEDKFIREITTGKTNSKISVATWRQKMEKRRRECRAVW